MDPLTAPFRFPLMPVRGVIKLGEVIQEEAEQQLHDPARIRRELEDAQRRYEAGEISDEEFARIQDELAGIEVAPPSVPGASEDRS
jgi:hypothetical protein